MSDANADGTPNLRPGETAGTNSNVFTGDAGALNALVNFGADGPGGFGIKVQNVPVDSHFDSKGQDVFIVSDGTTLPGYVDDGVEGYQGGSDRLVFTLTVGNDGSYTFTLLDQIDHPTLNCAEGDDTENSLPTASTCLRSGRNRPRR